MANENVKEFDLLMLIRTPPIMETLVEYLTLLEFQNLKQLTYETQEAPIRAAKHTSFHYVTLSSTERGFEIKVGQCDNGNVRRFRLRTEFETPALAWKHAKDLIARSDYVILERIRLNEDLDNAIQDTQAENTTAVYDHCSNYGTTLSTINSSNVFAAVYFMSYDPLGFIDSEFILSLRRRSIFMFATLDVAVNVNDQILDGTLAKSSLFSLPNSIPNEITTVGIGRFIQNNIEAIEAAPKTMCWNFGKVNGAPAEASQNLPTTWNYTVIEDSLGQELQSLNFGEIAKCTFTLTN